MPDVFSVFGFGSLAGLLGLAVFGFGFPFVEFFSSSPSGPCSVASVLSTEFAASTDSTAFSTATSRRLKLGFKLRTEWESLVRPSDPADGIGAASAPLSSAATIMARKDIVRTGSNGIMRE